MNRVKTGAPIARSIFACCLMLLSSGCAEEQPVEQQAITTPRAFVDGEGLGWTQLDGDDFVNVNGSNKTWTWTDGEARCSGKPISVIRSAKPYTNFELVLEWRHRAKAGNSGVFLWTPAESLEALSGPGLPSGIEVQVLDPGYEKKIERKQGRKPDWFTGHGDVFPVKSSTMKPFPPVAPNGQRSFPSKRLTRKAGEWNHYYIRAINGEVRLWVNGEEVSGGTECNPSTGYLCLESEGSPVDFRNLRIRELP